MELFERIQAVGRLKSPDANLLSGTERLMPINPIPDGGGGRIVLGVRTVFVQVYRSQKSETALSAGHHDRKAVRLSFEPIVDHPC